MRSTDDAGFEDITTNSDDPIRRVTPTGAIVESPQNARYKIQADTTLAMFERLADSLYAVRRLCPRLAVLAIQWMHPKHPIHLVHERLMRGGGMTKKGVAEMGQVRGWLVWRVTRCCLYTVYLSFLLTWLRWKLRREISASKQQRFEVIAKTWCFGTERPADDLDFYYGDLQRRLRERNVRMLLLCGNASTSWNWNAFAKAHVSTSGLCRLPELCLVHPFAPFSMAFQQILTSIRLRRLSVNASKSLIRRICDIASRDSLHPSTTRNGLFFWLGKEVVETWHPQVFMTLYEGHGWEKCSWWGAKEVDARCKTVGYQHTVIFRETLSLTRPCIDIKERSLPDLVLGLGKVTVDLMRGEHQRHGTKLIPFGSFRYQEVCSDRPANPTLRSVLVTPEGLPSEAKALFTFAYECARLLPSYTFILRSHPVLPMNLVLKTLSVDVTSQPNIVISDLEDITQDFKRSSVLIYRGSSVVLYAILHGLFPINVRIENLIDTDPLYMLESWRKICTAPMEFADILEQYERTPVEQLEAEWRTAVSYVKNYTIRVEEGRIDQFLAEVGLGNSMRQ